MSNLAASLLTPKLFAFLSLAKTPLGDQLPFRGNGGANRDRTDDLKLAKLALSQLSYGPVWTEE